MFGSEHKLRYLFGAGLLIFISVLIWAGFTLIRDTLPVADRTGEDRIFLIPGSVPMDPAMPGAQETPNPPSAPAPEGVPPGSPEIPALPYTIPSGITMPERPPRPAQPRTLVFVIDDAGNNLHELEPFLHFPGPLTIAVLPGLPYSAEAARRIRAAGKELILHQPMEAIGGQDPGPGAIYSGMRPGEIRAIVESNLREIGPVAGMNNHQGSRITMDPGAMEIILTLCREKGIYFLDSRTIADTAAPELAKQMGIQIGERDIFLDNIQERPAMIRYVEAGLEKAEQQGRAIMIGHAWSKELAGTLGDLYPNLIQQGYSLSTLSHILEEQ